MRNNRVALTGAAFLMASVLAACSSGDSSPSDDAPKGSSDADNSAPVTDPEITFIQGVIGDNFYISMECGARDASKELGVDITVQGGQKWDAAIQQPLLSSVTATNPDAILIAPNDVSALQRQL